MQPVSRVEDKAMQGLGYVGSGLTVFGLPAFLGDVRALCTERLQDDSRGVCCQGGAEFSGCA